MSDFLAGAGVLLAAGASAAAILLPAGRPRSAAMLARARPLPGPDPRRPVAHPSDRRPAPPAPPASLPACVVGAIAVAVLGYLVPPLAAPAAAGDRRRAPLPRSAPRRRRHRQPLGAALPRDRRRRSRGPAAGLGSAPAGRAAGGERPRGVAIGTAGRSATRQDPPAGGHLAATSPRRRRRPLRRCRRLYSEDFSKGLQNVCFFLVPFTLAYALLRTSGGTSRLLTLVLCVVGVEAARLRLRSARSST